MTRKVENPLCALHPARGFSDRSFGPCPYFPRVGGRAHKIFRTGVSPGLFWDWQNLQKFWNGYDAHSKTTYPWGFQKGANPFLSGIRKILCALPLGRGIHVHVHTHMYACINVCVCKYAPKTFKDAMSPEDVSRQARKSCTDACIQLCTHT